jgi:Ca-activated chloride channel homolog
VSFGAPWAFVGLLLAIPLVLLHLRRRRPRVREVPSLLAWRRLPAPVGASTRRLGNPAHPWLLALQLLALVLFVLALAKPHTDPGAPGQTRAFVVDDSIWIGASEAGGTRLEAAQESLGEELEALPGGERVALIAAGPEAKLLYEGDASGAAGALAKLRPTYGPADLAAGLRLAAGLPRDGGGIELLRAPESPAPKTVGDEGDFSERVVGKPIADQGIAEASARCLGGSGRCRVFGRVENTAGAPREDQVTVLAGGKQLSTQTVRVPAGGAAPVDFNAPAGAHLELALASGDPLAADDRAFVAVPAAAEPFRITLVGEQEDAEPLARALFAVPGAKVTLRTPVDFRPADARRAELLVIDGRLPKRAIPDGVPAILRIDPPRLPGGKVVGSLARSRLSGTDEGAAVLDGIDLGSLTIGAKGAQHLVLPSWLRAVAWAPGGPLLALGTHQGQSEAVLAFDPSASNLPQLPTFPRLVENLVAWSREWAPSAVTAGEPFLAQRPAGADVTLVADAEGATEKSTRTALKLDRPGFYALRQKGPWGVRSRAIVANADPGAAGGSEAGADAAAAESEAGASAATTAGGAPVDLTAAEPAKGDGTDLAPWFLGAALLVLLVEAALSIRLEGPDRLFLALRALALALLVVALLKPQTGEDAPPTTVVAQASRGVDPAGAAVEREWAEAAGGCHGRCRVLAFGGATSATGGAEAGVEAAAASAEPGSVDLESAVREAVAATPGGGRVVVLANGRQTRGEAEEASAAARARNVSVDVVPLPEAGHDAAITRLQAPEALRAGDPLPLSVNVRSTVASAATVSLFEDGKARGNRPVRLAIGDNPYLLSLTAGGPGAHSYRVVVRMKGDEGKGNDALATTARVVRAPRALVVAPGASSLTPILEEDGIAVTAATPAEVPTTAAALSKFASVALDDVAAPELGGARAAALADAVRSGQTGLVVLGGPHSFSLGGYYSSPLQAALPVGSLKPGNLQRRNLGLQLVLDRSGSMSEHINGVEKMALVRVATHSATEFLAKHHDQLGAIAFDVAPHTVVPLTRLNSQADAENVNKEIDRIHAEGGTNIYKALAAGAAEIEKSTEQNRHVVLLSDGISEKGSYAALVPRLKAEHITVSTVALGLDADFELLQAIAKETGGHFYATVDPRELPKIFAKDARAAARPVKLHGKIGVTPGVDSPIVRDLAGAKLPTLKGNVVTELKPGAQAVLLGQDKDHPPDPTLSQWQYGAGRVVAWTPGIDEEWAGDYAKQPAFFADMARYVEPAVAPDALTPRIVPGAEGEVEVDEAEGGEPAAGAGTMEGSIVTPGGEPTPLPLEPRAPWRWTAALPDPRPGVDAFAVRSLGRTSRGLLAVPYSSALRPLPTDATPLGPLAAGTGGRVLAPTATGVLTAHRTNLWWWFALAAFIVFLADVAARLVPRRRVGRRRGLRPRSGAARSEDRRAGRAESPTSAPA